MHKILIKSNMYGVWRCGISTLKVPAASPNHPQVPIYRDTYSKTQQTLCIWWGNLRSKDFPLKLEPSGTITTMESHCRVFRRYWCCAIKYTIVKCKNLLANKQGVAWNINFPRYSWLIILPCFSLHAKIIPTRYSLQIALELWGKNCRFITWHKFQPPVSILKLLLVQLWWKKNS